ncbi:hypothetical protein [Bacillus amyloliquefaciens]|nr:hypothetical protein [Bacillus amyloliquefaciens]
MHLKSDRRKEAYVCGGYIKFTTARCSSHIIEGKYPLTNY